MSLGYAYFYNQTPTYTFFNTFGLEPEIYQRPRPETIVRSINGHVKAVGFSRAIINIGGCTQDQLNTYIAQLYGIGSSDLTAPCTVQLRDLEGNITEYNALAERPLEREHYIHIWNDEISNLRLFFTVLGEATIP